MRNMIWCSWAGAVRPHPLWGWVEGQGQWESAEARGVSCRQQHQFLRMSGVLMQKLFACSWTEAMRTHPWLGWGLGKGGSAEESGNQFQCDEAGAMMEKQLACSWAGAVRPTLWKGGGGAKAKGECRGWIEEKLSLLQLGRGNNTNAARWLFQMNQLKNLKY